MLKAYQLIFSLITVEEEQIIIIGRVVGILVPAILAGLVYKKSIVALWLMVGTLLVSGLSSMWAGIFIITTAQYYLKPIMICLGLYFTYGGIKLFSNRRERILTEHTENIRKMV